MTGTLLGLLVLAVLLLDLAILVYHRYKPLPPGLRLRGPLRPARDVRLLADLTGYDSRGLPRLEQTIFDEILRLIDQARRLVVLDMFLFSAQRGAATGPLRRLCDELTDALLAKRRAWPQLPIVLITDPFNTLYGGIRAPHLEALRSAGVQVVETDLTRLRDANPLWTAWWRILAQPLGNSCRGGWLPSPVGPERVTLRTYLRLLNFKANHRKTLVVDAGDDWVGLVTSANPHDASSRHDNVALRFAGQAALDLLRSEQAVWRFSGGVEEPPLPELPTGDGPPTVQVQVLTEAAIRDALIRCIDSAGPDDQLCLVMFFLCHRGVLRALKRAHRRGVLVRLLLDPNKDAFGREKGGIPNRQAGWELRRYGIPLRWADTRGEQCHSKWLLLHGPGRPAELILGSANATRRNLDDYNLETDVRLVAAGDSPVVHDARQLFERQWGNLQGYRYSVAYAAYADPRRWRYRLYRFMEFTGWSIF